MIRWLLLLALVSFMVMALLRIYVTAFPDIGEHQRFADESPGCLSVPAKVAGELKFYRVEMCQGKLTLLHPIAYADLAGK